jgi:hypothetical protein
VVWKLKIVDSCPPCCVALEVKTLPTLPTKAPLAQSAPVWSRKFLICPHRLPKRVGVPKSIASAVASSSTWQTGTCANTF